ncbi:PIR Superfamily Protein [Plasmodium ovale wallikeri]|uniref:PIR Superfamily Protein n=1 Tax=Plasmodium ovale wallikeri TaxID=864142 RepID=A0A1A9AI56_PLAOA|nr:PIR Superfamily Protein [Plasmodium ovale wallikeri]
MEEDEILNTLNSYIFYGRLDREKYLPDYTNAGFWHYVYNIFPTYKEISDIPSISNTLLKGFYHVSNMGTGTSFYEERWNYLYFWMGTKVFEALRERSKFSTIMHVAKIIRDHFDSANKINDHIYETDANNFSDLKRTYDYIQNYDTIENKFLDIHFKCTEKFDEYIKNSQSSYEKLKELCQTYDGTLCKAFSFIENRKGKKDLSKFKCEHFKSPSTAMDRDKGQPQEQPLGASFKQGDQIMHSVGQVPGIGGEEFHHVDSPSSLSFGIALPILGIIFLLFVLYKFTPVGPWLHTRHWIKKRILRNDENNEVQENETLLDYVYEDKDGNEEHNMQHISYQPIWNNTS